ncbi:hypothetical protein ThidrDRAFT_1473 [Thiorhodococcus drewsii AZ1]|uniref:Uncharacterized protein n=1 Tax=Thiorhodococcus drewsii AZ1 TaxID=765913 RepID=G2DZL0_9GAMM|nr:hypothetical protein [Thiorhodococcus drewsii]EGV32237.1 hypothetical protein ThidrDRAFT_1473 [Thiorhodococcus drewsii AZ1]
MKTTIVRHAFGIRCTPRDDPDEAPVASEEPQDALKPDGTMTTSVVRRAVGIRCIPVAPTKHEQNPDNGQ